MMPFLAAVVYALRHTRGSGQRSERPEGDRVSEEPKGLSASGDIIGALSDRVSELTKRVGSLESELDAARKRVAVYEEFDATVRDALSGALRSAHEIRARAEKDRKSTRLNSSHRCISYTVYCLTTKSK